MSWLLIFDPNCPECCIFPSSPSLSFTSCRGRSIKPSAQVQKNTSPPLLPGAQVPSEKPAGSAGGGF